MASPRQPAAHPEETGTPHSRNPAHEPAHRKPGVERHDDAKPTAMPDSGRHEAETVHHNETDPTTTKSD